MLWKGEKGNLHQLQVLYSNLEGRTHFHSGSCFFPRTQLYIDRLQCKAKKHQSITYTLSQISSQWPLGPWLLIIHSACLVLYHRLSFEVYQRVSLKLKPGCGFVGSLFQGHLIFKCLQVIGIFVSPRSFPTVLAHLAPIQDKDSWYRVRRVSLFHGALRSLFCVFWTAKPSPFIQGGCQNSKWAQRN